MPWFRSCKKQDSQDNILFKNGQFQNQDIFKIGVNNATISDGSLLCSGLYSGFLIEDVNVPTGTQSWFLIIRLRMSEDVLVQVGTCSNGLDASNMQDVIESGTGRITYVNDTILSGEYEYQLIKASDVSNSMYFGSKTQLINYYIDEIYFYMDEDKLKYFVG